MNITTFYRLTEEEKSEMLMNEALIREFREKFAELEGRMSRFEEEYAARMTGRDDSFFGENYAYVWKSIFPQKCSGK